MIFYLYALSEMVTLTEKKYQLQSLNENKERLNNVPTLYYFRYA